MPAIVSSRTRRLYHRPPSGPVCLNRGSMQANGLVAWWPFADGVRDLQDYAGPHSDRILALSGAPTTTTCPVIGGFGVDLSGTNQSLRLSSSIPVAAAPFTVGCWFRPDNVTVTASLVEIGGPSGADRWSLQIGGNTGGDPLFWICTAPPSGVTAQTSTGFVAGEWQHACGVAASATSRAVFLNAGGKGTNTSNRTPAAPTLLYMGEVTGGLSGSDYPGHLAYVCIWNRALSDAEVYALYDPPTRWDLYYPLGRVTYGSVGSAAAFDAAVFPWPGQQPPHRPRIEIVAY